MSSQKDFYNVLGVSKNASVEEIKKAFYKLAAKHHPDKGGDEKLFKEANEAYQTLSDKDKRASYDRYGHSNGGGHSGSNTGGQGGPFGGFDFSGFGQGGMQFDSEDLEDMLGGMFGGFGRSKTKRGSDMEIKISMNLKDAMTDFRKELSYMRRKTCTHCKGTGGAASSSSETCSPCKGSGKIKSVKRTMLGNFETVTTCAGCKGSGKIYKHLCESCKGNRITNERETVSITVPAGVSNGEALKMSGYGESVADGVSGDLIVHIEIKDDSNFVREGHTLVHAMNITLSESLVGVTKKISCLDGEVSVVVKPLSKHGEHIVVNGRGMPKLHSRGRGDLVCIINVQLPKKLTSEQLNALEKLKVLGL